MSDKITEFVQLKDADNNIVQYDVSYEVEHDTLTNTFCVVVMASEMTTPSDVTEAKTKANAKASVIKAAWVDSLPAPTATSQDAQVGDVTLS